MARLIILAEQWLKTARKCKSGVIVVAIGGCKIELFRQGKLPTSTETAPSWMKGNDKGIRRKSIPEKLVEMAKLAQKDSVLTQRNFAASGRIESERQSLDTESAKAFTTAL
ncbi:MAG: hypothetical protein IPF54_28150 [Draconibacterium sp.]|nr:hypothetical protein [Draconibacterium sp.]